MNSNNKYYSLFLCCLLFAFPGLSSEGQGLLRVDSIPVGAGVYLDGKVLGKTPYSGMAFSGKHILRLELAGYRSKEIEAEVPAGSTSYWDIPLQKATGVLRLNTEPATASVIIDGRWRGKTPLDVELVAGRHLLVLELKGYMDRKLKFDSWDGGVKELDVELWPKLKAIQKWEIGFLGAGAVAGLTYIWAYNHYDYLIQDFDLNKTRYLRGGTLEELDRYLAEMNDTIKSMERTLNISDVAIVTAIGCASMSFLLYAIEDRHFFKFVDHFVFLPREERTVVAMNYEF